MSSYKILDKDRIFEQFSTLAVAVKFQLTHIPAGKHTIPGKN
jgi:hypothetical protein